MEKTLSFLTKLLAWLQIAISPTLIGGITGFLIYQYHPTTTRLIVGLTIAILGLLLGILWATHVCKKKGTEEFMSKVSSPSKKYKDNKENVT